ncbi:hypothetical protein TWF481_006465 [Arthrobotrys musiformis]|uniref:Uncharacterized protein n=1 Tax=Arthrobotrys musiformis TaxID=47236 RepID=A0AAV9WAX4_9PEZI
MSLSTVRYDVSDYDPLPPPPLGSLASALPSSLIMLELQAKGLSSNGTPSKPKD